MINIWTIAKREYKLYFASPIAYVIAFAIFLIVGAFFALNLLVTINSFGQYPPPGVEAVTSPLIFMLVLASPFLTMRLLSEEQRLGTLELLLTAPVRDYEVVVGKWLGAFLFVLTIIAITFAYPLVLNALVDPGIDQGPLLTGYLGLILVSAALLAIGVASSSFFSSQVAAAATTFGIVIFMWWIVGFFGQAGVGSSSLFSYIDFSGHFYDTLMYGTIALGDLVYYLSITALSLFIGTVSVEMRRWR